MSRCRWLIFTIEAILILIFWFIVLLYVYNLSKNASYFLLLVFTCIEIYLWNLLYTAKKELPKHKRYIYHLVSYKKLEEIKTPNFDTLKNQGIVHIRKSKKGFKINYSTFGESVTYFHSTFKGYSYFFNHLLKKQLPEYLLIIPFKGLDESLIYTRTIDQAILYKNDYIGTAKVIDARKFKFLKRVNKKDLQLWFLDTLAVMLLFGIMIQLIIFGFKIDI